MLRVAGVEEAKERELVRETGLNQGIELGLVFIIGFSNSYHTRWVFIFHKNAVPFRVLNRLHVFFHWRV